VPIATGSGLVGTSSPYSYSIGVDNAYSAADLGLWRLVFGLNNGASSRL